jgi:hypothetical protein
MVDFYHGFGAYFEFNLFLIWSRLEIGFTGESCHLLLPRHGRAKVDTLLYGRFVISFTRKSCHLLLPALQG